MKYETFIKQKKHSTNNFGFDATFIPDIAFDFQAEILQRAVKKGRIAAFVDTGLGKTLMQLSIAQNIVQHTNKPVIILTPLAVAFQFLDEAAKIGIDDIEYSKDGNFTKKIVISNYERLHHFDSKNFVGAILDESSILKNFDGKIKNQVNSFVKKIDYRFLSTATPAPNDFIELGTSSEALGYMGYMDMLGKFFRTNQNSVDSNNRNVGEKFYLKPHAEKDFFAWVNQWAIMVRKPSDIGFSDDRYQLPALHENTQIIENDQIVDDGEQLQMFNIEARNFNEIRSEVKATVQKRCEKSVELAKGKTSVYWVNRNDESNLIASMDSDAIEILGSMSIDKKEDILINFAKGNVKRLITKAKMTGMGLNWQHCNHSTFFPTWSYEQYYQSVRRFWRFGQKKEVTIDLVISDGQTRVIKALKQKMQKSIELYKNLTNQVNTEYNQDIKEFNQTVKKPTFI